jgi:aspartate/tyrosine/aromatic aminotransferase
MACQSFAKNFGLYSQSLNRNIKFQLLTFHKFLLFADERAGNLTVVLNDVKLVAPSKSQFTLLVRGMYSNPPNHGASIVSTVLNTPELCEEWCVGIYSIGSAFKSYFTPSAFQRDLGIY